MRRRSANQTTTMPGSKSSAPALAGGTSVQKANASRSNRRIRNEVIVFAYSMVHHQLFCCVPQVRNKVRVGR